jgi:hypothetical protein
MAPRPDRKPADDVIAPSARQATGAGAVRLPFLLQRFAALRRPRSLVSRKPSGGNAARQVAHEPMGDARDRDPPTTSFPRRREPRTRFGRGVFAVASRTSRPAWMAAFAAMTFLGRGVHGAHPRGHSVIAPDRDPRVVPAGAARAIIARRQSNGTVWRQHATAGRETQALPRAMAPRRARPSSSIASWRPPPACRACAS